MLRTAIATLLALASTSAAATIVTVRYPFPDSANNSFLFGWFGGEWGPISEGEILSTTFVISDFTTTGEQDAADLYLTFDVPVLADHTQIYLLGTDLGWSGQGVFNHSFTTDLYNGPIRPGRFGAEFAGGGEFVGESYVEFTVDAVLPDPLFMDGFDTSKK